MEQALVQQEMYREQENSHLGWSDPTLFTEYKLQVFMPDRALGVGLQNE